MNIFWKAVLGSIATVVLGVSSFVGYEMLRVAQQKNGTFEYQPVTAPQLPTATAAGTPAAYSPNCKAPADREDANLCGQWAAVAQAAETNRLASLSLRLSIGALAFTIIGTGLLIWTLQETRQTSRRELRAYVSVQPRELHLSAATGEVQATIGIRNDGNTPAYRMIHKGNIFVGDEAVTEQELSRREPRSELGRRRYMTIPAGENASEHSVRRHKNLTDEEMGEIQAETKALYCFGTVEYDDTFGISRVTRFCFRAELSLPEHPAEDGTHPQINEMRWAIAPFHNDST